MEEIKAQIIHRVKTAKGPVAHGIQYDFGSHKSNIVCTLCLNRNKLHTSKTLKEHTKHVLQAHKKLL